MVLLNKPYKQNSRGPNCFQELNCIPEQCSRILIVTQIYPAHNKENFTMFGIQLKITRYIDKQKNMTNIEEENQLIQTHPQLTQILTLTEKNIKTVIIIV